MELRNCKNKAALLTTLCCLLASCAELRFQTIRRQPVWLSRTGDSASLAMLKLLDSGKKTPGNDPRFVEIERGSQVYVTEYSAEHCKGANVFEKVQVKTGSQRDVEGWICGASTTHRKAAAL
jgi:hypothetical protein